MKFNLVLELCRWLLCILSIVYGQEIIDDKVCEKNPFVRTFNEPEGTTLFHIKASSIDATWNLNIAGSCCRFLLTSTCETGKINCTNCDPYNIICGQDSDTTFNGNVTSAFTLDRSYQNVYIYYFNSPEIANQSLTLKYCTLETLNEYIDVDENVSFGNTAVVSCRNNTHLIINNQTVANNRTDLVCGKCGLWEKSSVYCLKVDLRKADIYEENSEANFVCEVNEENVVNTTTGHKFYINNIKVAADEVLTANDNNAHVYCEVELLGGETVRSQSQTINVTYKPKNVSGKFLPTQIHELFPGGILIKDSQEVEVICSANSNPDVNNCSWYRNGNVMSKSCQDLIWFNNSGEVNCEAGNYLGYNVSSPVEVLISGPRSANITNMKSSNSINEGTTLRLRCSISHEDILNSNYKWTIPNSESTINLKSHDLILQNVTRKDNGSYICETSDKFGNHLAEIQVIILYRPYEVKIVAENSTDVQQYESLLLLNSNKVVQLECFSEANPRAQCIFNITGNLVDSSTCYYEHIFTQDGDVWCSANNSVGGDDSPVVHAAIVEPRSAINQTLTSSDESVISGQSVTMNCSIPYQVELGTIFKWTVPSQYREDKFGSLLYLNNLTRHDLGNYTCSTEDVFGKSLRSTYLNVHFAAEEIESNSICTWDEVANNLCYVIFTSNPPTREFSLKENELVRECHTCYFEPTDGNNLTQKFVFLLEKTSNENSLFTLRIASNTFLNQDLIVEFTVEIGDVIPSVNQTGLIVGCVVGGVVAIAIAVAVLFYMRRQRNGKQNGSRRDSQNNGSTDNHSTLESGNQATKLSKPPKTEVYSAVDFSKKKKKDKADSEKEEQLNPLYDGVDIPDQITNAYDSVDVNGTAQSEKEDRINPLYDVGQRNGVEESYATVDKTKKIGAASGIQDAYTEVDFNKKKNKKNKKANKSGLKPPKEKGANLNPMDTTSQAGGTLDAYATVDISKKAKKQSSEKEERLNPLYDMGQGNGVEDAYSSVDKSAKRDTTKSGTENKVTEGQDTGNDDVSEATYATVNQTKKMKKQNKVEDANSSKGKKPPQTFKVMDNVVGDTYAVVKKDNTKVKGKKEEIGNPLYDSYHDQPTTSGCNLDSLHASYTTTALDEVTYAVVDKSWKSAHSKPESIKPTLPKKPDQQQSSNNDKPKIGKKPSSQ